MARLLEEMVDKYLWNFVLDKKHVYFGHDLKVGTDVGQLS